MNHHHEPPFHVVFADHISPKTIYLKVTQIRSGYVIPRARYGGESAEDSLTHSWCVACPLALGTPEPEPGGTIFLPGWTYPCWGVAHLTWTRLGPACRAAG